MKNYIKLAAAVITIAITSLSVRAERTNLFNAHEFGLSLGTGYTVDPSAAFKDDYAFNLEAGAFYFLTKHIGVEINVPFYATSGPSFSEVQFGTLFRLPLSDTVPILRNLAPYLGIGGVYNFHTEQELAYIAKAGLEVRLNPNWGVFSEAQYRNSDFEWSQGEISVKGGIRLVF